MSGQRGDGDFQAYVCAAALAFIIAVAATLKDPLPRLTPWQGAAPDRASDLAAGASAPAAEKLTPLWPQGAASDDVKDAVASPSVNAAALALARYPGGLPPAGERAPLPGAAVQAAARASAPRAAPSAQPGLPPARHGPEASLGTDERPSGPAPVESRTRSSSSQRAGPEPAARGRPSSPRPPKESPREKAAGSSSRDPRGALPLTPFWKAANAAPAGAQAGREKSARAKRHKHRPLLRRGRRGALTPPRVKRFPSDNPWEHVEAPKTLPGGAALEASPFEKQGYIETVAPPEGAADRLADGHWDQSGAADWYRDGELWGRRDGGHWTWLERSGGHWWLWPNAKDAPLVWHDQHWWWHSRGTWFVLHDGEAWVFRRLNEWEQDGLAHADGSRMIYSGDGRVGLIEPGRGARVYDDQTGEPLDVIGESRLPAPRHPTAPSALSLPR